MNKWSAMLVGALILAIVGLGLCIQKGQRAYAEEHRIADSLAAEIVVQRMNAEGWETRFAETVYDLDGRLAQKDTALANLSRELTAARVRIRSLTEIVAEGSGTIVDTVEVPASQGENQRSIGGRFDDGILSGSWQLNPRYIFTMNYKATIRQTLIHSETGDGRWVVMARATDPRVNLLVDDLLIPKPDPIVVQMCPLSTRAKWAGIGAVTVEGLKAIFGG